MHYAFYMHTIFIIWSGNEDEDEGETYCHMDRDKCSYSLMKYDTTKCIFYMHLRTRIHSYILTYTHNQSLYPENTEETT